MTKISLQFINYYSLFFLNNQYQKRQIGNETEHTKSIITQKEVKMDNNNILNRVNGSIYQLKGAKSEKKEGQMI